MEHGTILQETAPPPHHEDQGRDQYFNDQTDLLERERNDELEDTSSEAKEEEEEEEEDELKRLEEEVKKNEGLEKEVSFLKEGVERLELEVEEAKRRNESFSEVLNTLNPVRDCLVKLLQGLDGDEEEKGVVETLGCSEEGNDEEIKDEELRGIREELVIIRRVASEVEGKVRDFKDAKEKEMKELQSSVVSLTEENRDISSLLRVALVEKESVERKLRGGSSEQKRVPLLQFAERGLRGVGFGFIMGGSGGSGEHQVESSLAGSMLAASSVAPSTSSAASVKSDGGSECDEEVVSLASTVEKIMKNLRGEITQLRRSLEESRSDNERLQSLTERQAQEIAGNLLYIKELEERERVLIQNVEELLTEIKETEADVARWREACELEVEAGESEIGERDKVVTILRQELEKTKASLEISNGKLKIKEELADAAMAAQAAAERSLQLADSRATELRARIEALTKQLEEAENQNRNRRKVRHICWPWRAFKMNAMNTTSNSNTRFKANRLLPEMQSLLQYST